MIGTGLSRREREILEVLHERGDATAADVLAALPDPPSNSAVRALLRVLEAKGHVTHVESGRRFLYKPTERPESAARSALTRVLRTFFGGSLEGAVRTFLTDADTRLSDEELTRLSALIEEAKSQLTQPGEEG